MTNLNSAAVPASVSLSLSSKASEAEGLEKFLLGMFANVAKEVEARAETDQVVVLRQEAEKAPVVEAPSAEDIAKAERAENEALVAKELKARKEAERKRREILVADMARPECNVCGDRFDPDPRYTGSFCPSCEPRVWETKAKPVRHPVTKTLKSTVPSVPVAAPKPLIKTCRGPCQQPFTPAVDRPWDTHCPTCHAQRQPVVAKEKTVIVVKKSPDFVPPTLAEVQAKLESKERERLAQEQTRLKAEGKPVCLNPECGMHYEPVYPGALWCHPCSKAFKMRKAQEEATRNAAEAKAKAEREALAAALKAQGHRSPAEDDILRADLTERFRAGKDMPEGVTYTRNGTQIIFKFEENGKMVSLTACCALIESELAEENARKAARVASDRAKAILEAEKARQTAETNKLRQELLDLYMANKPLPEGVTVSIAEKDPTSLTFDFGGKRDPLKANIPQSNGKKDKKGGDKAKGKKKLVL